jgi:hypothetical protein
MATALKGKGKVFATGDPWVYDEHIAAKDNIKGITQMMNWLLGQTTGVFSNGMTLQKHFSGRNSLTPCMMFLPNGRLISAAAWKTSSALARSDAAAPMAHGNAFIMSGPTGGRKYVSIR